MADGKATVWFWLGIGCITVVILGVVCTAGAGFFVYRAANKVADEMRDPAKRAEKAAEVLGCETLPEGYHALFSMALPFDAMKIAVLTDEPPNEQGEPGDMGKRGFVYVSLISAGAEDRSVRDYFEGKTDDASVLRKHDINVDTNEIVDRGVIDREDVDYLYVATRGRVQTQQFGGKGLTSITLVDCPADSRTRIAIWFAPDPDPASPFETLDVAGTPADPAALEGFLGHFSLCR